jgi:mRNA-degrading endonuclease toxin of MazEF toxin-antitoxin module
VTPGDVVRIDFGVPTGSEPLGQRPAIVISGKHLFVNGTPRTLHVVPLTSNTRRKMSTEVAVDELSSVAQVHLTQLVSRERIVEGEHGNVGVLALRQIRSVLAELLDIE